MFIRCSSKNTTWYDIIVCVLSIYVIFSIWNEKNDSHKILIQHIHCFDIWISLQTFKYIFNHYPQLVVLMHHNYIDNLDNFDKKITYQNLV
jgi:hypothetical protein